MRALYDEYCSPSKRARADKPYNADWVTYEDVEALCREDCPLRVSRYITREAYALCKMTVIDELGPQGEQQYQRLIFVEFLEFLARVSDLFFAGSEMETLELHEKIEYVLDEILPIVNYKRVKQEIIIDEFSESDEDY